MAFDQIFNGNPISLQIVSASSSQNPQLGIDIDGNTLWVNTGTGWIQVGSGGSSGTFVNNETPIGLVNNSNTIFTLAHTPISGSQSVYYNGVLQNLTQYSIVGSTITFTTPPVSGGILVSYRY